MGMYTQLKLDCSLKKDTPKEIIDYIKKHIHNELDIAVRNPLFGQPCKIDGEEIKPYRDFYFNRYDNRYVLRSHNEIKNVDGVIKKFLDVIKDYVYEGFGDEFVENEEQEDSWYGSSEPKELKTHKNYYAWTWYEEFENPTFYYVE